MSSELLIESDRHETRCALLEHGRVVEIDIERTSDRGLVGNIYKGRVSRVLPGIQAAFVDVGLERDAFLYVGDVESSGPERGENPQTERPETLLRDSGPRVPERSIEELVQKGQDVLVQVTKDPLANKGSRVTTQISLPGRLLVALPRSPARGVSRRITDEDERARLLALLQELHPMPGGIIVRTAAIGRDFEALRRDLDDLTELWDDVRQVADGAATPTLVHQELDSELRAVRDVRDESLEAIRVTGAEAYRRIDIYLEKIEPELRKRLRLDEGEASLFERYGVEREIEAALRPRVWLESGGFIVVSPTEALVAIDVNTGRFVGAGSLEETVVQTNLEAASESARQIRLRNLGGIIVIDFIDMAKAENRQRVMETLQRGLEEDRARSQVLGFSDFGLVQITRKRSRPSLELLLTEPCTCCSGRGRIRSAAATALGLRREVKRRSSRFCGRRLRLRLHPETLQTIEAEQRQVLEELREDLALELQMEADPAIRRGGFELLEEDADSADPGQASPLRHGS